MHNSVEKQVSELITEIRGCQGDRLRYQPQVDAMIRKLTQDGRPVPRPLLEIRDDLGEEAREARFDNLPL